MRTRITRKKAFTLLETVVVLGLCSVLIAVMGSLFQSFMSANKASTYKQTALQACLDAFDQVSRDLGSAVNITEPTPGTNSSTVQLTRVYPYDPPINATSTSQRFPPLPPNNTSVFPPSSWTQFPTGFLENVTYTYDNASQALTRSVTYNGVTTNSTAATGIGSGIAAFSVYCNPTSTFANITVTTMPHNDGVLQVAYKLVPLHLPPAGDGN